jgi:transcription initiation factor TFIID TATA-box-binding protein
MSTCSVQLRNVVATGQYNNFTMTNNDLLQFSQRVKNTKYKPKSHFSSMVTIRLKKHAVTVLIFNSGKFVINGAKTITKARQACDCAAQMIKRVFKLTTLTFHSFTVQNMVYSGSLGKKQNLSTLAANANCSYNPDIFPGLICRYRYQEQNTRFLLFHSGKFVLTGFKTDDEDCLSIVFSFYLNLLSISI